VRGAVPTGEGRGPEAVLLAEMPVVGVGQAPVWAASRASEPTGARPL